MSWIFLTLAIITEVAGTVNLKLSEGFTKLWPSILIFVFYGISFSFTTLAVKKIDLSVVYAIWSGLGTALVVLVGILYFKEQVTPLKILSICLIVLGVIGLNLGGGVN
ncbi:MAG: multidrug efflux SMR transporter [Anaerolineales bacterium]|nr:multidrug efflux SMR transporter [Anaerolineales bacterium]MCK5315761.1 multidrug efflux SMR transporter [Anaerolineales bacterium]